MAATIWFSVTRTSEDQRLKEVPPVADVDYHPLAYINNQSLTDPFSARKLGRQEVEQLDLIAFLGLIHGSLP